MDKDIQNIKIGAKKHSDSLFEVSFTMDRAVMEARLAMIENNLKSMEEAIKSYQNQKNLLEKERDEIRKVLSLPKT